MNIKQAMNNDANIKAANKLKKLIRATGGQGIADSMGKMLSKPNIPAPNTGIVSKIKDLAMRDTSPALSTAAIGVPLLGTAGALMSIDSGTHAANNIENRANWEGVYNSPAAPSRAQPPAHMLARR